MDGEPVYCTQCKSPIVVYRAPSKGYRLVCGCPATALPIDHAVSESSLFEPISGKWSSLDSVDPWEDTEIESLREEREE